MSPDRDEVAPVSRSGRTRLDADMIKHGRTPGRRNGRARAEHRKIHRGQTKAAAEPRFRSSTAVPKRAPEGIRTPNLLIRSRILYPLSYGRRCLISVQTDQTVLAK